jgi:NADPH2:quinone reductase
MNAVLLDAEDQFAVTVIDDPVPAAGQVAIRVAYAGIQWGDVLVRQGHFPVPRPFVPGFEAAGEIVAVGEGVLPSRIGQRVAALTHAGAFADVVLADDVLTFDVGDTDSRTAAGFGWVTPTAYALINEVGRVRAGEHVLVHAAAGGVGTLAAQYASLADAGRVVGVVLDEEQRAYASQFPYDRLVLADEFPAALGDNECFDVILDPIGGDTRLINVERLAPHGRLVVYGNIATFAPVEVGVNDLLMQGKSLLTFNSNLLSQTDPARLAASARAALEALTAGDVRIDVTAEYAMDNVDTALERLAAGATHGKSILRVS